MRTDCICYSSGANLASETSIVSKTSPAPLPSKTPREPRNEPTNTPVTPTDVPSLTPIFDASSIRTVTPAPEAECPNEDSSIKIDFLIPRISDDKSITSPNLINDEKVLDYLNMGGSLPTLLSNLQTSLLVDRYKYQDFTGDGEKVLLIEHFAGPGYKDIHIYTCAHGIYQSFSAIAEDWAPLENLARILAIKDLNKNGIPDIVISDKPIVLILEWMLVGLDKAVRGQSSAFRQTLIVNC